MLNYMDLTFFMVSDLRMGRGGENVLLNLLKYKPLGTNITIVETDYMDKQRLSFGDIEPSINGCKIIRIHTHTRTMKSWAARVFSAIFLRPISRDLRLAKRNGVLDKIRQTDMVYLFFNPYSIFFKGVNYPVCGSCHSYNFGDNYHNKLFRNLYQKLNEFLYFKDLNCFHFFPKYKDKLQNPHIQKRLVLPNGVDCTLFHPSNEPSSDSGKLKLLFVGALSSGKGLDIILQVVNKFISDEVEFHIVGGGTLESILLVNKKVIFHGVLSITDLIKMYQTCDVFIYPSHEDMMPLVILEALACGLYVVTTDYMRGNFDEFEGKYLEYIPRSALSFYNKLCEFIKDKTLIQHDKVTEFELVKNNYDWPKIAERFYTFTESAFADSRKDFNFVQS